MEVRDASKYRWNGKKKKQPCYSLLIELAPSAGSYCSLSQADGVHVNTKKDMSKKAWKVFETAFFSFPVPYSDSNLYLVFTNPFHFSPDPSYSLHNKLETH